MTFPKGNTVGSAKRFQKGHKPTVRRAKGTVNKITRSIKDGIIDAAVAHGSNGKGKDGLPGFFQFLLRKDLKSFARLVGRLLPVNIKADENLAAAMGGVTINVVTVENGRYLSEEEIRTGKLEPVAIPPPVIEAPPVVAESERVGVPVEDYEPPANVTRLNPWQERKNQ